MSKLLIIDGMNLLHRIFEASGADPVIAAENARRSLLRAMRENAPTHAVLVLEGEPENNFRREIHAGYKAQRPAKNPDLLIALRRLIDTTPDLSLTVYEHADYEGDDVVATLAAKASASNLTAVILSTDKDFCQLLSLPGVVQRNHFKRTEMNAEDVLEKYGVRPEQFVDLQALAGDAVDGIPGVPLIGMKVAADLIRQYGDLDTLLAEADQVPGKRGESLRNHADTARLSRELARLRTDLLLGLRFPDLALRAK